MGVFSSLYSFSPPPTSQINRHALEPLSQDRSVSGENPDEGSISAELFSFLRHRKCPREAAEDPCLPAALVSHPFFPIDNCREDVCQGPEPRSWKPQGLYDEKHPCASFFLGPKGVVGRGGGRQTGLSGCFSSSLSSTKWPRRLCQGIVFPW